MLLAVACERQEESSVQSAQEHAVLHADPGYICPMHPQITADEPGSCPICGMDLVRRKAEPPEERQVLHYRHPHDPRITSERPMKDEMGMDYIPVYAEATATGGGVRISPEVRNNLGVRVAAVRRGLLPRTLRAFGQVAYDASEVRHIHARAEGWVEKLHVSSVGDRVTRGSPLLELYSPRLVTAQEEYLQALRMGGDALVAASETRLKALGISDSEIRRVREAGEVSGRIVYRAPSDGVVTRLEVREGMFVQPDTDMFVLANLERVWIEADVLARQSEWLRAGVQARVRLDQLPGRALEGELAYVYPEADPRTRAVRVRLAFDNPGEVLKPNSFATVTIEEPDPPEVLIVPREALIRTSTHTRVIVETEANRFAPRAIEVGYESGEMAAVLEGLDAGDRVVVSGQFMLDSEASLRGELDRITGGEDR
jgi:Cu(I)/Ag(I) efflux system membrane fusion protein